MKNKIGRIFYDSYEWIKDVARWRYGKRKVG